MYGYVTWVARNCSHFLAPSVLHIVNLFYNLHQPHFLPAVFPILKMVQFSGARLRSLGSMHILTHLPLLKQVKRGFIKLQNAFLNIYTMKKRGSCRTISHKIWASILNIALNTDIWQNYFCEKVFQSDSLFSIGCRKPLFLFVSTTT